MVSWWNSLNTAEYVLAIIAIPATLLLILQTVMLLFSAFGESGLDGGHDHDFDNDGGFEADGHDFDGSGGDFEADSHDFDGSGGGFEADSHDFDHGAGHSHAHTDPGLRIFTVRGMVTFFCIFGWSGLALMRNGADPFISILAAITLGVIFMFLMAFAFMRFTRLQSDGTLDVSRAAGAAGTVYIPVPGGRSGKGKVSVLVSDRLAEFDAVTDEERAIPTQTEIIVVSVTEANTMVVKTLKRE